MMWRAVAAAPSSSVTRTATSISPVASAGSVANVADVPIRSSKTPSPSRSHAYSAIWPSSDAQRVQAAGAGRGDLDRGRVVALLDHERAPAHGGRAAVVRHAHADHAAAGGRERRRHRAVRGACGLVAAVAVEVEVAPGDRAVRVRAERAEADRPADARFQLADRERDDRRQVLRVDVDRRGRHGHDAAVVRDAQPDRAGTRARVRHLVLELGILGVGELLADLVGAVAVGVEFQPANKTVRVVGVPADGDRLADPRVGPVEAERARRREVGRVHVQRGRRLAGAPVIVGGTDPHARVPGRERSAYRRAGRVVERAIVIEIPREREPASGAGGP